ncbi:MAG: DNA polymerase III subunit delta [Rubrivivax sp.]
MQLRPDQLGTHLANAARDGLKPLYTVVGDEPLLQQEAADALRAAARASGCSEREVFNVSGAHFDWSGVLGAAQERSLFAEAKIIEIRIPSGKPGKEGSEALQRYAEQLPEGVVTLVLLPTVEYAQLKSAWFTALQAQGVMVKVEPVERPALPAWIARRLAAQGQRVREGEEGQRTLAFFADRVEGHLLAAHQEISKLALLYPPGELTAEQVESAVLNVARYDVRQLCEAVLAGQVGRAWRILDGLRAEGESPVAVHWPLADDLRALQRVRAALDLGQPMPMALNAARVWGPRQRQIERAVALLSQRALTRLVGAASLCDGITKGLRQPDWPDDPWEALRRLILMTLHFTAPRQSGGRAAPGASDTSKGGRPASLVLSV